MKKYKVLIFILFLLSVNLIHSQNNLRDSLMKNFRNNLNDSSRFNLLISIGKYYQNVNPDSAIYFNKQAIIYAEKIQDELKKATAYRELGWNYFLKADYENAMNQYNSALFLTEKFTEDENAEMKNKARKITNSLYSYIGSVYGSKGEHSKSLEYLFKALKGAEQLGDKSNQSSTLSNIGNVYTYQQEFSKALTYYFKCLELKKELKDKMGEAITLGNIGIVFSDLKNEKKALEYDIKSLKISEGLGDKVGLAINFFNIGNIYNDISTRTKNNIRMQQILDTALTYYFKGLKISQELEDKGSEAYNFGNIGLAYMRKNKLKEAEEFFQKALKIDREIGEIVVEKEWLKDLSELYEKQNQFEKAYRYFKQYISIRDTMNSDENIKKQTRLEEK